MSFLINSYILSNTGAGLLAAGAAGVAGAGAKLRDGSGELASTAVTVSGAGGIVDAGRLYAEASAATGAGQLIHGGTGALVASTATIFSEPFDPAAIAGMSLWLDADDITTLYQDSAKTTQVTSSLDPVGCWADKSTNGWDFIQSDAAKKPTYVTYQMNNKSVIKADGTEVLANAPNTNWTFLHDNTASTVFIVYRVDAGGADEKIIFGTADAVSTEIGVKIYTKENTTGCGIWYRNGTSSTWQHNSKFPVDTPSLVSIQHDPYRTGNDFELHNNMQLVNSYSSTSYTPSSSAPTYPAGLFGPGTDVGEFVGGIAEVIVYDSYLSESDRDFVATYLSRKWRLTLVAVDAALIASTAVISGAGTITHAGTGSAVAALAAISGAGHIPDTGNLYAGLATASGVGVMRHVGSGTLAAATATVYGSDKDPSDIAGLQLWLDSSDIATLYTDSAKTTQVAANDDRVGCWADKSGNGYDFLQAVDVDRPTYKTDIIHSRPTIYTNYDGRMVNTTNSNWTFLHDGTDHSVFLVFLIPSGAYQWMGVYGSNNDDDTVTGCDLEFDANAAVGDTKLWWTVGSSLGGGATMQTGLDTSFTVDVPSIAHLKFDISDVNDMEAYNGRTLLDDPTNVGTLDTNPSPNNMYLFDSGPNLPYPFVGHLAELIMYDSKLVGDDLELIRAYLEIKWGIS